MSSTSTVCQGLQSCLDPLVIEPLVLVHKLATSKQASSFPWPKKQTENPKNHPIEKICENNKNGQEQKPTWNLLQSLTKSSYNLKKSNDDQEEVYIHPLVKRSTSALSSRSLEMCTESLGSETGDGIDSYNGDFSYYNIIEKQSTSPIKIPKTREIRKKVKHSSSFPPPLTSISGNDGVQVKTHREGGRLVIKAYNYSSYNTCFETERENGRLRLSLPRESFRSDEEEIEEEQNVDEYEKFIDENDEKEDEFNGYFWGESVKEDVRCKTGGKDWSNSSRCNGDRSKRIPSLPFCVAIS